MPLKILILSHNFNPFIGGIEVISEFLANALYTAEYDVHLATWSEDSGGREFPFKVIRNPSKYKLLQEHKWADLIFENNPCLRLSWPQLLFNKPLVVGLHTWIARPDGMIGLQDRLKFWWLKRAKKVIAVSDAVRKRCWPNATVIGNPYRVNDFKIMNEVNRTFDFVFLGRLVSDKGADLAIRTISRLHAHSKTRSNSDFLINSALTIIGDGPERKTLERLVFELELKDHIHFKGLLTGKELVTCLNQHRFLLVPSVWEEPFGIVALEGMACGCLPIVSDGGGLPDAVGNAGLVFKRGDEDALFGCILKVLEEPEFEQQFRDAAKLHLEAHWPDVITQQYLKEIERALI